MEINSEYYTLKGYQLIDTQKLTYAMEDYLEMIYRININNQKIRLCDISSKLNVKPSSASKMIVQLNSLGYIQAQKYGNIMLTKKGKTVGNYLLYRHNVIYSFLCELNGTNNQLEETEKIEHYLSNTTIKNLEKLTLSMNN